MEDTVAEYTDADVQISVAYNIHRKAVRSSRSSEPHQAKRKPNLVNNLYNENFYIDSASAAGQTETEGFTHVSIEELVLSQQRPKTVAHCNNTEANSKKLDALELFYDHPRDLTEFFQRIFKAGRVSTEIRTRSPKTKSFLGMESIKILSTSTIALLLLLAVSVMGEEEAASLPRFLEPIPNKTVVVGRDVILPCSVDNLKGYKVAWIFVDTQTILTIHHTIISKNPRFTLARNDHKHWYLRITNVKPSDRGYYMCQVNSDPMMSQKGFLEVQVPPDIIDEKSSSEVVVQEGNDVTLHCHASGSPKPIISWKREDGGKIHLGKGINLKVTDSEVLHIPKVSRLHMGAYLCIASNDVPPSVSKRITLKVQFAPVLWIPNQLVSVSRSMDVHLECHTEAFPRSINYWTDTNGKMILSSGRFDSIVAENGYKAYMKLKIRDVQPEDFGTYGCSAKNSFGESNGTIKVYEIPRELIYNAPPPRENISDVSTSGTDSRAAAGGRHSSGRWQVMVESDEEDDDTPAITITPDGVINYDVRKLFRTNGKPERRAPNRRPPSLLHPPFSHSPSLLLRGISHLLLTLCVSCIIAHLRCPQLLQ